MNSSKNSKMLQSEYQQIKRKSIQEVTDYDLISWIKSFKEFTKCSKIKQIKQCRDGLALAEIISTLLHKDRRSKFLQSIQTNNITSKVAIQNLRIILMIVQTMDSNVKDNILPQQMYESQIVLRQFMIFLHKIWQKKTFYSNIEELSQIVEISGPLQQNKMNNFSKSLQIHPKIRRKTQPQIQEPDKNEINQKQKEKLQKWLKMILKTNKFQPHEAIGQLANIISKQKMFGEIIIKKAHFQMGPIAVWRKLGSYLPSVPKIKHKNVMQLLQEVQSKGIVRESLFWNIVKDIYSILKPFTIPTTTKIFNAPKQQIKFDNQMIRNKKPSSQKLEVPIRNQAFEKLVKDTEKWLDEAGYLHSLKISQQNKDSCANNVQQLLKNPLLNGCLIGSIVMRLKIGKPIINKNPTSYQQIRKNIQQIIRVCISRGYHCTRNLILFQKNYEQYIKVIAQLKSGCQKSSLKPINILSSQFQYGVFDDDSIQNWLNQTFHPLQINFQKVDCQDLSMVCSHLIKVSLYRQTTKTIQLENMRKILDQMRKMGISRYYGLQPESVVPSKQINIRKTIIADLYSIFGKSKQI